MSKGNVLASGADLSGKYADVVPRPASSILLIRDADAGLEVFMVKRHHKIDFASGAMVIVVVRIVRVVWLLENVEALVIASAHPFSLRVAELHASNYQ